MARISSKRKFIFGPSGCGKTHLVNAIGVRLRQKHPEKRVLYVSAHRFQVQYPDARINNKTNDFIHFYQSIDCLIVDDVQEFSGKEKTLETFFHIFNHLHLNGRQIIMTSDRPPVELKDMEERMLTRFKWGMLAELESPDVQLRHDILVRLVRKDGLDIPEERRTPSVLCWYHPCDEAAYPLLCRQAHGTRRASVFERIPLYF